MTPTTNCFSLVMTPTTSYFSLVMARNTIFTPLFVLIRPGLLACPFATVKTIAAIIAPTLSYKVEYNKCRHKNEYNRHKFFPLVRAFRLKIAYYYRLCMKYAV